MIGGSGGERRFSEVVSRLLPEVTELEGHRGRRDYIVVVKVLPARVIVVFRRLERLKLLIVEQALHCYQFRV